MSAGNCGHLLLQKLRETCGQQVLPADRIKGGGKVNEKEKEQEQKYLEAVDVSYSYGLAKAMERIKSNPVLGFRTAGSRAEYETGEMLRQEMERIGLKDIHKDRLCLDGWEFEKAVLRFQDAGGEDHVFQLGAYQTQFVTGGFQKFPLVYAGRGGVQDYAGRDVRGCLVLVDINQRDEWWINFPVYQAHLKGAAAVIAVQDNGYGEIDGEALNAQDIAGPKDAPAFSISQKDAAVLKAALQEEERLIVEFDASSRILEQTESYNIWGTIPGREEDMILLSAHYDSYYDGFQDDNCAVAMMLGIARALLEIGYRPRKTLVFCAMAAEEWGIVNSKYDWSTGAWQQVFKLRPDWPGKVIADLNFELPAYAHNAWDAIRSTYEYEDFLKEFVEKLPVDPTNVYPQGLRVHCPIETWSDDFSMAISGIPSMVNEFSSAGFMETHYHSQFDRDEFYDEAAYRFHHELYGLLLMALDRVNVAPVNLERTFRALRESVRPVTGREDENALKTLMEKLEEGERLAREVYEAVRTANTGNGEPERDRRLQSQLLYLFKKAQGYFVRLNWHDEVLFPHEASQTNLRYLGEAVRQLEDKNVRGALEALYQVDNNKYAFQFDDQVYRYFTEYVMNQEKERLQWGAGRIVHHLDLSKQIRSLMEKERTRNTGVEPELEALKAMERQALGCFDDDIRYMIQAVDTLTEGLRKAKEE